jgi:4-amino-4-deoxy-L-arabinose transferase-like glycosyltransferase
MRNLVRYSLRQIGLLPIAAVFVLILAPLPFVTTLALWPRWIAILALAWWLPGVLLVAAWRLPDLDLPTAGVFAAGLGLCWMILLALLIHWLPGPIGLWPLIAVYEIGALALLAAYFWRRPVALQPTSPAMWRWVLVLFILAILLRLPGLGYHEMHIDEASVLRVARDAVEGQDNALARNPKGPSQIAVALVVYRALGTINESTGRMPFGLMSVASVLAVALLGRRLFSPSAGFWAGVLFALNGFALGLSRIIQYQPAVLLFSALAVLAAWEFAQRGAGRWLALALVFSAFGLATHYEYGLLAPALFVLAWAGWKRAHDRRRILLVALAVGLAGAILVAASYLPIVLAPQFSTTQEYLGTRVGGLHAFNVGFFVEMGTFYNSSYYFFGLILLVLVGLYLGWRTARRPTLLLALWFIPFFFLLIFIIEFPGTHFYQLMESWSLLAALPLAALTDGAAVRPAIRAGDLVRRSSLLRRSSLVRRSGLAFVIIWLGVSAGYLYLMFFRQAPEYLVNYDQTRVPFYWAPYGTEIPEKPRFGFPIREGWKTAGLLGQWGYLGGTWASNERSHSLSAWYLDGFRRQKFDRSPAVFFIATHMQEPDPLYSASYLEGYARAGEIRVRGEPRIEIWAREPLPVPYAIYDSEQFEDVYDTTKPVLNDWPQLPVLVRGVALGDAMELESASLAQTTWKRGDTLHLVLIWRPQQTLDKDYKLFVHIADASGRPLAQWDGFPCLNTARTSLWEAGKDVTDHVLIPIPADLPPGEYSLLTGFYDPASGERLEGQAARIGTITVR